MKKRAYIPLSAPVLEKEEKKAVVEALSSGWVTLGPKTAEFEEQFRLFTGAPFASAVSSATAGIHLALIAAGIGPGDEVIAPAFTFAATINPVIHVGATPVLVDIRRDTYNIDVSKLVGAVTKKTKAIIPVHYGGQSADMDPILSLARKHNCIVIEDAAHALGTKYKGKMIGSFGDMAVFSFHPIKNITTGDGGMVTTAIEEYDKNVRLNRLHGMNKEAWKRFTQAGSWYYEITSPGFKYNMTDISAAIGIEQMKKLDMFLARRREYALLYTEEFHVTEEISTPYVNPDSTHSWNLYSVLLDPSRLTISRDEFIEELKKYSIGASVYFLPLHMHPYYRDTYHFKKGQFPNAEWVYERILSLPLSPKMTEADVRYVAKTVKRLIHEYRRP